MRRFLSPGERRLLESLEPYPAEREIARALFDELDAHLVAEEEPETVGSMAAQLDLLAPWKAA